jgi:hypothetical protein
MPGISSKIGLLKVRRAIDAAEADFRKCWGILCAWKRAASNTGPVLLDFQPTLANALYNLDQVYNLVVNYRDFLIENRGQCSRDSLSRRLRLLDKYASALKETMAIGRSLGDAFAWLFYSNSSDMLRRHLAHPPIRHFPTGIGGRGEVEFIRHARAEKHFLLHHGITNFLRVGDVSFVDLATWTVTSLGELKSHGTGPGQVHVTLHAVSESNESLPRLFSIPGVLQQGSLEERPSASPEFKRRLAGQVKGMRSALSRQKPSHRSSTFEAYSTKEFSSLARDIRKGKVAYARVGPGGTLAALRPFKSRKLSSRLFAELTAETIAATCAALPGAVADSCEKGSSENSLLAGGLTTAFGWGSLPFFWWPLDLEFLEQLYFQEVYIFSCYNPVHLLKRLRQSGFEISKADTRKPTVTRRFKNKICELENFDFFLRAIQLYLMREEKVAEMLATATEIQVPGVPSKIEIEMVPMI